METMTFCDGAQYFELAKMKVRAAGSENKHKQRLLPMGSQVKGLFGVPSVRSHKSVVITEGEFDAMAVYQATMLPSISLPHGANNLSPDLLPFFDNFETIYLWLDADSVG